MTRQFWQEKLNLLKFNFFIKILIISEIDFSCAVFGGILEWREISLLCNALFRWWPRSRKGSFMTIKMFQYHLDLGMDLFDEWLKECLSLFASSRTIRLRSIWETRSLLFHMDGWFWIWVGEAPFGMNADPLILVGLLGLEIGWWLTG